MQTWTGASELRGGGGEEGVDVRRLLDALEDGAMVFDLLGRYLYINGPGARLLGASAEELVGRCYLDIYPEAAAGPFDAAFARVARGASAFERVDLRDEPFPGVHEIRLYRMEAKVVGIWRDLTDVRRQEEAAARQQALFTAVLEQMPAGVVILSRDGRMVLANRRTGELVGEFTPEPSSIEDFAKYGARHPDGRPYSAEEYPAARSLLCGERFTGEMLYERPDGHLARLDMQSAPVLDADGEIVAAVVTMTDASAPADAQRYFRFLFDHLPALGWTAEPDGAIDFYNRRWYAYTGTRFEEMRGWGWQAVHDPRLLPGMLERWKAALASGQPFEMEVPLRRADGVFRWFLTRVEPIRDATGRVFRWVGLHTDIEERRQATEREKALRQDAERSARFAQLLVGTLGHDLRNPLSAIVTGAQVIERAAADERFRRAAGRIVSSGERMARMIDQLLDFTRLRIGGGLTLQPAPLNLRDLAHRIVEETAIAHPDRAIRLEGAGDAHGEWDGDRLAQVLSNLLANALQHGTPGTPVRLALDGRDPARVLVEVINEGAVPASLLPVLFEPFRGVTHARSGARGLGLGLYISQQIAQAHGGSLTVTSTPEEGTHFRLTLPRTPPASSSRVLSPS